jgi:hypothetical protein
VAQLFPTQRRWRARIEAGLRIAGPGLDLLLATGDRLSRILVREKPTVGIDTLPERGALPDARS